MRLRLFSTVQFTLDSGAVFRDRREGKRFAPGVACAFHVAKATISVAETFVIGVVLRVNGSGNLGVR